MGFNESEPIIGPPAPPTEPARAAQPAGAAQTAGTTQPGPATWAAPPTQPAPLPMAAERSSWPTVLGVVAIILGALAALGGLWGMVAARVMSDMMGGMPGADRAVLDITVQWQAWTTPLALGAVALGALLVVGGGGLAGRRRWARPAVLTWAGVKIVLVVVQAGVGYMMQQATFAAMSQTSPGGASMPSVANSFTATASAVGVVIGLLWGWAGPVFAIIWLSRAKIRAEVAEWK